MLTVAEVRIINFPQENQVKYIKNEIQIYIYIYIDKYVYNMIYNMLFSHI